MLFPKPFGLGKVAKQEYEQMDEETNRPEDFDGHDVDLAVQKAVGDLEVGLALPALVARADGSGGKQRRVPADAVAGTHRPDRRHWVEPALGCRHPSSSS